ncbi:MAG: 2-C-methyl-D-erythritol 4-phosphate cytidylyltransferase [Flavobacteriales bacterium]
MQKYAIIVGGGTGIRFGSSIPKQFLELKGKPVLLHALQKFYAASESINIILVLPKEHIPKWENIRSYYKLPQYSLIEGGKERFHSVKNGLKRVPDGNSLVAVHDAVRPLTPPDLINEIFNFAEKNGNAIPSIEVKDSMRRLNKENNYEPVDRKGHIMIQTPQCFYAKELKKAFEQDYHPEFTDEASIVESIGIIPHLTEGDPINIKITDKKDLALCQKLMV